MFSYRHGFHAGNHADVLKHVVLVQLLQHMTAKDTPFTFIDTHAGAGCYSLEAGSYAAKKGEYESGVARLWNRGSLPRALTDYLVQVAAENPDNRLARYPGSPQLASRLSRETDRLRLFELHPTEARALADYFRDGGRRVSVRMEDGFDALKSVLPPPSRRALVLVDPSYEDKADYARVPTMMREALHRFATGVYAVWYPQVRRRESTRLPADLQRLGGDNWLHVTLTVAAPPSDGFGLYGSGMFIFNPPWLLAQSMREALPAMAKVLGLDQAANFSVDGRQR